MNQEFFLNAPNSKKGVYLSQQQIDLLLIVACESKQQLEGYFSKMCGQFPNQNIEDIIPDYAILELEEAKRVLFSRYQESLTDYQTDHRMTFQEQAFDKLSKMHLSDGSPIPPEIIQDAMGRLENTKTEMISILQQSGLPPVFITTCINEINNLPKDYSPTSIIKIINKTAEEIDMPKHEVAKIRPIIKEMMQKIQGTINSILVSVADYDKKVAQLNSTSQIDNFIQKFNRLMRDDFENVKSVSYEDIATLHRKLLTDHQFDTIIIATGKYDNSIYNSGKSSYFDAFLTAKGLQYCKMTGKHMRYHALFDYAHLQKLVSEGKGPEDKEQILAEMREFIKASFEFINNYNSSVKGTNEPTINVIEIFNELVEYNRNGQGPYEMAWEKHFGITVSDIVQCFEGIKKPEGVEFMYNETMLEESPERVAKVEEVFNEIMTLRPDLIDVFGNQMHLQHTHVDPNTKDEKIGPAAVEQGLDLMSKIQDRTYAVPGQPPKRVRTEITELDIHIPKEFYIRTVLPLLQEGEFTPEEIVEQKKEWFKYLSSLIKSKGLDMDRVTYWSLLDTVDHNLVRACKAILDANPDKSIEELREEGKLPDSLYAGAFGTGTKPLPTYEKAKSEIQEEPSVEEVPESSQMTEDEYVETIIKEEEKKQTLVPGEAKKLIYKPNTNNNNSGYIGEYIILLVIICILLSLVMLTIFSIA